MNLIAEEDGIRIVGEVQIQYEKLYELKQQVPCHPSPKPQLLLLQQGRTLLLVCETGLAGV